MTLEMTARLSQKAFAPGEKVPLLLSVANSGPEPVKIVDPRKGGDYFRLRFGTPGTVPRTVSIGETQRFPGVPSTLAHTRVPSGDRCEFDFDVAALTGISRKGSYLVSVEYEWKPGEVWRSEELPFVITEPAGTFLDVVPSEASRNGHYALVWGEAGATQARALLLNFRVQDPDPAVRAAVQIAAVPRSASPALSMSPAGAPFPDRWMAWTEAGQLHFMFSARESEDCLPARAIPIVGPECQLIRPLLAEKAPDEGRPGCLIGLVRAGDGRTAVLPLELNGKGEPKALAPVTVPGVVREAWASPSATGGRLFVLVLRSGKKTEIAGVEFPAGGAPGAPKPWLSLEDEFLAGDVRLAPDQGLLIGLLSKRGEEWQRMIFQAPEAGRDAKPKVSILKPGPGATAVRTRLDARGGLHVLFLGEGLLRYAPPDSETPTWSNGRLAGSARFFDLLFPAGRPALACYDTGQGPIFVRL